LQPTSPLSDEFNTDCLIWTLFNRGNLTASANDLEWNGKKWSIVNHFIPYTEAEVNAPGRFESDFMVQYLDTLRQASPELSRGTEGERDGGLSAEVVGCIPCTEKGAYNAPYMATAISPEAQAVLDAGRTLWQAYFAHTDARSVREEFKLNRPDVGWYQIRNALKARNASGDYVPVDFSTFEAAYKSLGDKLRPQVYEYGFLR
jgi:hypothetical protein